MLSASYDKIYSRFLSLVEAYDLIDLYNNDKTSAQDLMGEWLGAIKSNPKVRKLYSSITLNDTDRTVDFTLKKSLGDDQSDIDYVVELFGNGVAWKWVSPKYLSVLNAGQIIGGKEMQFYSQANHMGQLSNMYTQARTEFFRLVQSYGYINNSYIDG